VFESGIGKGGKISIAKRERKDRPNYPPSYNPAEKGEKKGPIPISQEKILGGIGKREKKRGKP